MRMNDKSKVCINLLILVIILCYDEFVMINGDVFGSCHRGLRNVEVLKCDESPKVIFFF